MHEAGGVVGVIGGGIGSIAGMKLLWDYFKHQGKFVTKGDCKDCRGSCEYVAKLQGELSVHKAEIGIRLDQHDSILQEIREDVKGVSKDVVGLSKQVAVLVAVMEAKLGISTTGAN